MFSNPPTPPGGDLSPTFGAGPAGPRRNVSDNGHQLHQRRPTGDGAAAGMVGPTDFAMREPSDENIITLMVWIIFILFNVVGLLSHSSDYSFRV